MKAIVLESFGDVSHLKLKQVETPIPKKGEVRIKIKAVGFNPVDFKTRKGLFKAVAPVILGSDCSGVIDAVSTDVEKFHVGDEVYALSFGQCSNGSYAEYVCLPAEFVAIKPTKLSFEQAAAIPLVSLTAYRAMIASGALHKETSIFIAGAGGGVGSIAVEMARYCGIKTIFSVAGSQESSQFLQEELGLKEEHILLYHGLTCSQMEEHLIKMNNGQLFGATFDFVGGVMKQLCLKLTAYSGHFTSIVPEKEDFDFPVWGRGESLFFNRNISLHFVFVGAESFSGPDSSWNIYSRHLNEITKHFEKRELHPLPMKVLGTELAVQTVIEAHHALEQGKVKGKLVMRI